jgi:hypothetical protein
MGWIVIALIIAIAICADQQIFGFWDMILQTPFSG